MLVPIGLLATIRAAPRYAVLSGTAMVITLFWNSFFNDGYIDRDHPGRSSGPQRGSRSWATRSPARDRMIADGPSRRRLSPVVAGVVAIALLLPSVPDWGRRSMAADRHADRSAQAWLDEVMPVFAKDAVGISWWRRRHRSWYAQAVDGLRPDIFIVDDRTMLDLDLRRAPDVIRRESRARIGADRSRGAFAFVLRESHRQTSPQM